MLCKEKNLVYCTSVSFLNVFLLILCTQYIVPATLIILTETEKVIVNNHNDTLTIGSDNWFHFIEVSHCS